MGEDNNLNIQVKNIETGEIKPLESAKHFNLEEIEANQRFNAAMFSCFVEGRFRKYNQKTFRKHLMSDGYERNQTNEIIEKVKGKIIYSELTRVAIDVVLEELEWKK